MASALATVVITPREQFSKAKRSLDTILACTDAAVPIIYVDGNSPRAVAQYVRERASRRPFRVLRTNQYLSANQARNWGLPYVATKYVAFVDNDVSVDAGWLDTLIACAEETGAWVVGPLYLIGEPAKQIIHMAGADVHILEQNGERRLYERHRFSNVPVAQVREQLVRAKTDLMEFHCMLVRMDVFDRLGPLDEGLLSVLDHVDFCLDVAQAGGSIYIEPAAVVAHLAPPPCGISDLPYFFLRFSDAWLDASVQRFAQKHALALTDEEFDGHRRFRDAHRLKALGRARGAVRRLTGRRGLAVADAFFTKVVCNRVIERAVVSPLERTRRARSSPFASPLQASKGV